MCPLALGKLVHSVHHLSQNLTTIFPTLVAITLDAKIMFFLPCRVAARQFRHSSKYETELTVTAEPGFRTDCGYGGGAVETESGTVQTTAAAASYVSCLPIRRPLFLTAFLLASAPFSFVSSRRICTVDEGDRFGAHSSLDLDPPSI